MKLVLECKEIGQPVCVVGQGCDASEVMTLMLMTLDKMTHTAGFSLQELVNLYQSSKDRDTSSTADNIIKFRLVTK